MFRALFVYALLRGVGDAISRRPLLEFRLAGVHVVAAQRELDAAKAQARDDVVRAASTIKRARRAVRRARWKLRFREFLMNPTQAKLRR
jgi:hypothetical protein